MKIKSEIAMSLIEVIVAVAILGILAVGILSAFGSGYININNAGKLTEETYGLKEVVDDLLTYNDDNISLAYNADKTPNYNSVSMAIINYLSVTKGYNQETALTQLKIYDGTSEINFYISPSVVTLTNTKGYEVKFVKFYQDGKRLVEISTFVICGGS